MADTETVRRVLANIGTNMAGYSDNELRKLKNSADTLGWMIRKELAARDARMVDEACALKEKSE